MREIKFTFCLEQDENIPGEFPYQSLERSATVELSDEQLNSEYFKGLSIEEILIKCLVARKREMFAGLALEKDYDRVIIKHWEDIAKKSNELQNPERSVARNDASSNSADKIEKENYEYERGNE